MLVFELVCVRVHACVHNLYCRAVTAVSYNAVMWRLVYSAPIMAAHVVCSLGVEMCAGWKQV